MTSVNENAYLGPIPNRIILGMVSETAFTGSLAHNPFNFQHFDLNHICLKVNQETVPSVPYTPNWISGDYIREYLGTLQSINKGFSEIPCNLNLQEFANGYTLFAFDLTPDHNNQSTISPQSNGQVRIELKFGTALQASITVILHAEYDAYLEIDQYKNITTNF